MGIAKGLANGDVVRNFVETLGLRNRMANGTMPDIPWPKQATQVMNLIQENIRSYLAEVQKSLTHAVNRNRERTPRDNEIYK